MGRRGYYSAYRSAVRRQAGEARRQAAEYRRQAAAYRRQQVQAQREARQEYLAARESETAAENQELDRRLGELETLLQAALSAPWAIDFERLKRPMMLPPFDAQGADKPAPQPTWEQWAPKPPGFASRLIPGWQERLQRDTAVRRTQFDSASEQWRNYEAARVAWLDQARSTHDQACRRLQTEIEDQHRQIDEFRAGYIARDGVAVRDYFSMVFDNDQLPDGFELGAKVAYVPESRQLIVERQVPEAEVVPTERSFKYVKGRDSIDPVARPLTQIKAIYSSVIAQLALRTVHSVFAADIGGTVDTAVLNCVLETINRATGKPERPCLLTVRTSRDVFLEHDLTRVDPAACLRHLSAEVSTNPYEVHPVRPIVDFNMVDPRFVDKQDILSSLESRPNLAELTPTEFESLITNLFEKMGLETRLTQPSRDGGVDCVAWDMRPIVGGKVIVQAKRYKNTVGISAVRDLFGTVHNEGAAKGILVSTSGYGKSAYEFVANKPLELITGGQLLYLLEEHSNVKARIEFPEDWQDPAGLTEHAPPAPPTTAPEPEPTPATA